MTRRLCSERHLLSAVPIWSFTALFIAGVTACSPEGSAPQDPGKRYLCDNGHALDIIRSTDLAVVRVGERIFNLHSKPGSLGQRYTDGEATLIIDGGSAVFASAEGLDLRSCELTR